MSNTAECIPNERALRMGCTTIGKQLMRKSISLFSQFEFMHESGGMRERESQRMRLEVCVETHAQAITIITKRHFEIEDGYFVALRYRKSFQLIALSFRWLQPGKMPQTKPKQSYRINF